MSKDQHSFHEQGFLLFYGLIMGLLIGVWGNLWADVFFEYVIKGDKSEVMTVSLIVITTILIVLLVILSERSYHFYKKIAKTTVTKPEAETSQDLKSVGKKRESITNENEIKKLLSEVYNKELTWLALTLTSFIGLIELLPEIKNYGITVNEQLLTTITASVGFILVGATVFSFHRVTKWLEIENNIQKDMPITLRKIGPDSKIGMIHKVLLSIDDKGNISHFKKWVVPLVILIYIGIWVTVIILKTM